MSTCSPPSTRIETSEHVKYWITDMPNHNSTSASVQCLTALRPASESQLTTSVTSAIAIHTTCRPENLTRSRARMRFVVLDKRCVNASAKTNDNSSVTFSNMTIN